MKPLRLMTDKVDSLEAIDLEDLCVGRALKNTRSVILMGMQRALRLNDFETLQQLDEMYDRVLLMEDDIDALQPD